MEYVKKYIGVKLFFINVPFERDFLQIAKINSHKTQKNRQSAKLNSRKNLVPHGNTQAFLQRLRPMGEKRS